MADRQEEPNYLEIEFMSEDDDGEEGWRTGASSSGDDEENNNTSHSKRSYYFGSVSYGSSHDEDSVLQNHAGTILEEKVILGGGEGHGDVFSYDQEEEDARDAREEGLFAIAEDVPL